MSLHPDSYCPFCAATPGAPCISSIGSGYQPLSWYHRDRPLRSPEPVATVQACELDSQPDSRPRHYVIVRSDLPLGVLAAMVTHAAGETGPVPEHTRAVVLSVPDEQSLLKEADRLPEARLGRGLIVETEGPYAGQLMAVGLPVHLGRRPELAHLPILSSPPGVAP